MTTIAAPSANQVQSTLTAAFTRGTSTTLVLTDGSLFPTPTPLGHVVYVHNADESKWCLLIYTSRATNTLTMGGGAADYALAKNVSIGDEAYEFPIGSVVELVCAADEIAQLFTEQADKIDADGTVPLTNDWDIGDNKILAQNLAADALTAGKVLFTGTAGILSVDTAFAWDDTNKRLGVGATIVPATPLDIQGIITTRSAVADTPGSPTEGLRMSLTGYATTSEYANSIFNSVSATPATTSMQFRLANGLSSQAIVITMIGNGNVGINNSTFGASAVGTIAIKSGTAPSAIVADVAHLWVEDVNAAAGYAGLHMMGEKVIKEIVVGVVIKTDTGRTADPHEGLIEINTFDNFAYLYGDGGWRAITADWS